MHKLIILGFMLAGMFFRQEGLFARPANTFTSDTSKINILNDLAWEQFYNSNLDSCLYFATLALTLSDSLLKSEPVKFNKHYLNRCRILKARSLTNIGRAIVTNDIETAQDTLQAALQIIMETGNKYEEASIYGTIGNIYDFNGRHQLAGKYTLKALDLFRELGDSASYAMQLTNVAITERNLGNYGEALAKLMEALKISEEIKDTANIIEIHLAMGFVYAFVEQWENALNSQGKALEIFTQLDDSLGIARVYNDMGVSNKSAGRVDEALQLHRAALKIRLKSTDSYSTFASYAYIGSILSSKGNFAEAVNHYEKGLHYAQLSGYKISIIDACMSLGECYLLLPDTNKALSQFLTVLDLSRETGDDTGELRASINIASIHLNRKEHRQALRWLQQAEKAASRAPMIYIKEVYGKIAESYYKLGDYKNAYLNRLKFDQVKDSLAVSENMEKITRLTNKLEFENKIALQNESNEKMMALKQAQINRERLSRNIFLLGMLLAVVLVIIIFVRFLEKQKLNRRLNETLANLRATQTQLVHAEKMASLGELTAGIAHEIQNPLNFVNNFAEVSVDMIDELTDEMEKGNRDEIITLKNDLKQNLQKINEHGKRAGAIVKGMLQHSRTGTGQKEPADLNALAEEYLRLSYHGLRAKDKTFNADFKTDLDPDLPQIEIIPQDIGRVLLNLINNAFYACAERSRSPVSAKTSATEGSKYKPVVIVSTRKLADKIEIRVKDNGNGIPDEIKDKIFQPFFTTKPTGQGTGLGLSLSYDIISKGHGGKLKTETRPGEGTEFIIELPT
ncbi:MAG: tetratricopeptide repeat protein [Bacteroidales bacterium]|nr:tetratricopeptide repeat protein [Bacteroidales bacterium]